MKRPYVSVGFISAMPNSIKTYGKHRRPPKGKRTRTLELLETELKVINLELQTLCDGK
jgi:hypothetical protein